MVTSVVDLGLLIRGVDPNKQLGFGNKQGSSCEFGVRMQDFYVNFQSRDRNFIMVLETDRCLMGVTAPIWTYLAGLESGGYGIGTHSISHVHRLSSSLELPFELL